MGLVLGRIYEWYLVIVVIFIGFGGVERGDALKSSYRVATQATTEGASFMGKKVSCFVRFDGYCKRFH